MTSGLLAAKLRGVLVIVTESRPSSAGLLTADSDSSSDSNRPGR